MFLDSKSGTMIPLSQPHSILFQFSSATTKSNAGILLGIIHNSTGQISYRLILINFNVIINNTRTNQSLSDELRLWRSLKVSTQRTKQLSTTFIKENKNSNEFTLIILIIILSSICWILIVIIIFLCHRHNQKPTETTANFNPLKCPTSSLSAVEKFHAPDLTTKVTLLTHFHLPEPDSGTDV